MAVSYPTQQEAEPELTYTYRETPDKIIVDRGIATREMTKQYDHGTEHASYEELAKAARRTPSIPIVLDTGHDHSRPLQRADMVIGVAHLKPCPTRRGLKAEWHFHKEHLPPWLETRIRRGENIPVSTFQFVQARDGQQRDILFDHVAVLEEGTPRCPPERCGVGVADAMTPEDKPKPDKPEPGPETPVSQPVSPEVRGKPSTTEATTKPEEQPGTEEQAPAETVADLQARLKAAEAAAEKASAALKQERIPLEGELVKAGVSPEAVTAMSLADLRTVVAATRRSTTQGLPGATPAPAPEKPKTPAEAKAEREAKFHKALEDKSKEEFKGW
jgi:hypothetical protein